MGANRGALLLYASYLNFASEIKEEITYAPIPDNKSLMNPKLETFGEVFPLVKSQKSNTTEKSLRC